ncbi:fungal-specific transcription factor domain-containing protein [Mycena vulgaris]|nr:fungal-specific transcription factor domain-containing protein [Mycena vulgaris]
MPPQLLFPDNDLLKSLIKIYFEQINPIIGILHFTSFCQSVADGVHFRDQHFGAVVLAVCSLASRYSDDPRVFVDGVDSEHSCGWKWFQQVRPLRASFSEPSLYQLQVICLSVMYLAAMSSPEECWIVAGLGLRCAQGAGAHHRTGYTRMKPLEAELYKRVFYILLASDTGIGSLRGRPCIAHSVDYDLDLPVDCDEEYWGIPNAIQPPGKPSTSAFMVAYLPLINIIGRIQRAVYAVNGQPCSPDTIVELDFALNRWVDALPEHLRWDPNQENQIFLDQSAALYASYYHGILFAGLCKESKSNSTFPSLAICANAARSCGYVLDVQTRRGRGIFHLPQVVVIIFDCAIVLLINVWANSRAGERYNRAAADVHNCLRVLRLYERRWRVAGRRCDIIPAMLNISKYTSEGPSLKRPRDLGEGTTSPDVPQVSFTSLEEGPSRELSVTQQIRALELSIRETEHLFSLPLSTEELVRLPIYDSFDYQFTLNHQPHSDSPSAFGPMDLDFLDGADPASALGSNLYPPENGREEIQLNASFDIPFDYEWHDWSTYLANVDALNQDEF